MYMYNDLSSLGCRPFRFSSLFQQFFRNFLWRQVTSSDAMQFERGSILTSPASIAAWMAARLLAWETNFNKFTEFTLNLSACTNTYIIYLLLHLNT